MIFMAKVCLKAINFATAESIHQLLALRPHPTGHFTIGKNTSAHPWLQNKNLKQPIKKSNQKEMGIHCLHVAQILEISFFRTLSQMADHSPHPKVKIHYNKPFFNASKIIVCAKYQS